MDIYLMLITGRPEHRLAHALYHRQLSVTSTAMVPSAPVRFTLRLKNHLTTNYTVVLEPWTGEYRLDAGGELDIVVEGTPDTPLDIELDQDWITITSFDTTDSMLTAFRDGKELRSEHVPPAS